MDGYALVSRLLGVQVLDKSTYLYYENTRKKVHIYVKITPIYPSNNILQLQHIFSRF